MKKLKQDIYKAKGITLIALVVTIVVLLILAAVSINMLTGENGIIRQAQEAKKQTKIGEEKDGIAVAYSSCKAANLGGEVSDQQLEDQLIAEGNDVTVTTEDGKLAVTYNDSGNIYYIDENGKIEKAEESNIAIKLTLTHNNVALDASTLPNVKEVTSENVPIPEGFYYVEGSKKDTGVVISDVEGDDLDNIAQGNQFVWVPVDQNQVLTLEVTSKEEITGITLTHPDGTQESITASGKTYNGPITMSKNGVYEVEVTTATSSKMASKRITSLYAQDGEMNVIRDWNGLTNDASESYNTLSELLEAKSFETLEDLLLDGGYNSIGEYMDGEWIYIGDQEEYYKRYDRSYYSNYVDNNQNPDSVEKYGGYYIGRYEAGDGTTTSARGSSTSDSNTLVSKKGAYVYNYVDLETSRTLASTLTTSSVTSQLITGAGWDRALNWIIETGGKTENEVICDSRSWGNYGDSTGNAAENSGSSNMNYTTGRSEYWKANNIYDMAGNEYEWTQEQYNGGTNSVYRGGDIELGGVYDTACYRNDDDPTYQHDFISFRPQFYIK